MALAGGWAGGWGVADKFVHVCFRILLQVRLLASIFIHFVDPAEAIWCQFKEGGPLYFKVFINFVSVVDGFPYRFGLRF